jgi:uncharacterized protein YcgI (DUF1989 family)
MDAERLAPGDWRGVVLEPGGRLRVEALVAGQSVELIAHSLADPRERLATTLTTLVEYAHQTHVGMTLWTQSHEPLLRVLDQSHGRHDLQLEACTPFVNHEVCGNHAEVSCDESFRAALEQLGLGPKWVPYPLGIFRQCGTVDGRFQLLPASSAPGDFIEFVAEAAVTVVVSACPLGAPRGEDGAATVSVSWKEQS